MAIEVFEIKWTGSYSLSQFQNRIETRDKGVYAFYEHKEIFYIGKANVFGVRLDAHKREWAHIIGNKKVEKLRVSVGVIVHYKLTHPSQDITSAQLGKIESFLINNKKPRGNPPSDKKGYKGILSPIIVNTGKIGSFGKVIFHNPSIYKLLKDNLKPKRYSTPSY